MREGIARRDFVAAAGSVVALACIGGFARLVPAEAELLRPPGGQDDAALLALCTRCDRCRSVCPTQAIAPALLEDGLVSVRTPKLEFKLGWCNFCGKCAEVCPTGALAADGYDPFTTEALPGSEFYHTGMRLGLAVVDKERCIAWAGPSSCIICSQKCPYQAITLDKYDRPLVDDGLCNGCGVCENVCPSTRLTSYKGGYQRGIEISAIEN